MKSRVSAWTLLLAVPVILLLSACTGDGDGADPAGSSELFAAARSGELDAVRLLIEQGIPVDSENKYGSTPLIVAAGAGQLEVMRYLLDHGADVNHRESFYGANALAQTLFSGDRAALPLLLDAGADDREMVLQVALEEQDFKLAEKVLSSGPVYASVVEELLSERAALNERLVGLLEQATTRPDAPLPELTPDDLRKYVGKFEGQESDTAIEVVVAGDRLDIRINGEAVDVELSGEDRFRSTDGKTELAFFGRAGAIEGIQWMRAGHPPEGLRHSVAEPVGSVGFTAASTPSVTSTATVHWPAFRGTAAAGNGDGRDLSVEWDEESLLWSVKIEGLGNSSPIVWGDRLFLTTAVAEGVDQEIRTGLTGDGAQVDEQVQHVWKVLAFDKWSGELLWGNGDRARPSVDSAPFQVVPGQLNPGDRWQAAGRDLPDRRDGLSRPRRQRAMAPTAGTVKRGRVYRSGHGVGFCQFPDAL